MEIEFQKEGYGEGYYHGQMRERLEWIEKIKSLKNDINIVKELLKGAKAYNQYYGNKYFISMEKIIKKLEEV